MKKTRIFDLRSADLELAGENRQGSKMSSFGQFTRELTEGDEMIADIDLEEKTTQHKYEDSMEAVVFKTENNQQKAQNSKQVNQLSEILENMVMQIIEEKIQQKINKAIKEIGHTINKISL